MSTRGHETLSSIAESHWMRTDMLKQSADGFSGIVQSHVTTGTLIDRQDADGFNALHAACQNGHLETVTILLDNGASPETATREGVTALMLASQENHIEIVELLLEHSAEPNVRAANGCSALSFAAARGNYDIVKALFDAGAEIGIGHNSGELPILSAAANGHLKVCSFLLEGDGEDLVDEKRSDGSTALLVAALGGHHEVISLLLRKGASIKAVRKDGKGALDLALSRRHIEAEKILREALGLGVKVEKRSRVSAVIVKEDDEEED